MRSIFGLGSKVKDKILAQRFEFTVTIHNLQPWPQSSRAVAIGWQRGKKKRGATRSVYATTALGKTGYLVRFNEKFDLTATLYKSQTGSANASQLGPFKKKCLILAVLETDGRTQATAALGRVVVDLAEFAAVDRQETRAFLVSCNKQIHSAVGDPQLLITIRTRWKKSSATVGAAGDAGDEAGSMSTDTTGSRMTANLSSFLRFKYTGKGPANTNEEQDLQGFESSSQISSGYGGPVHAHSNSSASRAVGPAVSVQGSKDLDKNYMGTIQESHDEHPESPPDARQQQMGGSVGVPRGTYDSDGFLRDGSEGGGALPGSLRARHAAASSAPPGHYPGVAAAGAGVAGVARGVAHMGLNGGGAYGGVTPPSSIPGISPRSTTEDVLASTSAMSTPGLPGRLGQPSGSGHLASAGSMSFDGMQQELLAVAATDVSVHLARAAAAAAKRPERGAHAAARRLARTLVCMGPQAPVFGGHVLRLIAGHLDCARGELGALAFWWSNLAHLRVLLQAGAPALGDMLLPQVVRLERTAFDSVVSHLWEEVLMPAVVGSEGGAGRTSAAKPSAATKRAQQEAAIKKWFEGLDSVNRQLSRLGVVRGGAAGHCGLLRTQALGQCLKRLDALLFYHLLVPADQPPQDILLDYDPANTLWGTAPALSAAYAPTPRPLPALDDASLPFSRGLLSFGSGMSVKMTVTRLQQWAAGDAALGEAAAGTGSAGAMPGGAGAPLSLFPLLRAAADLLMMPKELLLEAAIRRDVCQALSMRSMLHILAAFTPDEYAADGVAPGILEALREEALRAGSVRPPLSDLSIGYRAPTEEVLLAKVGAGIEPGLEYDAESEDELSMLSGVAGLPGAAGRFKLLHDLWAAHAPRGPGAGLMTAPRSQASSSTTPGTVPLPNMGQY